jgi:serine/threonine-protein kinase RsbW
MRAVFKRSLASLEEVYAFTEKFFAGEEVDGKHLYAINLVLEELFSNMVKFNEAGPDTVSVEMLRQNGAVRVQLSDQEPEPFDVTTPRPLDIDAPLERREESGMGLFLVQKFVDSLDYTYRNGTSTITFVKRLD